MKFRKTILTLALVALALPAFSQISYSPVTALSYIGTYTNCAGSSATNVAVVMDVRQQSGVAFSAVTKNDGAGTANMGYFFQRSVDGVNYEATGQLVTIAANGNANAVLVTNLNTYGVGWIKLAYITNAAAATVNTTNITIGYALRKGL
jgi:hypothetical protein